MPFRQRQLPLLTASCCVLPLRLHSQVWTCGLQGAEGVV